MALTKEIKITSAFLSEYKGLTIWDQDTKKYYLVTDSGLEERPESEYKTASAQQAMIVYSTQNGLPPANKDTYQTSESYRFVDPNSSGYQKALEDNFGKGATIPADQYTGKTMGTTSGGTTLYQLQDGSATATPPPSGAKTGGGVVPGYENETTADPNAGTFQIATSGQQGGQITAEFKGDANVPARSFTGSTKAEIDAQARAAGINPVNLFYDSSPIPGVVPSGGSTDVIGLFKGDDDHPLQKFTGATKEEVDAKARAAGINPVNLFYNGSDAPGVVPEGAAGETTTGTSPGEVLDNNDLSTMDLSKLPEELTSQEWFKNLESDEAREMAAAIYMAGTATSDADKAQWLSALEQAKELVDPFFAQQIVIAQDEILRGFQNIETANKMRLELIDRNIKRIDEDLAAGTERLTVDQQAQMTRLKRGYENQLVDLQNQISDVGMAFGSKAGDLLSRAAIEQKDVQTSSARSFGRRMEDLNLQASRGKEDEEFQRRAAEEQRRQEVTGLARESEKLLGTAGFTEVTGKLDSTLQDVLGEAGTLGIDKGTLEQQRTSDIISTAGSLFDAGNPDLSTI